MVGIYYLVKHRHLRVRMDAGRMRFTGLEQEAG
jgi:hypothetical protein